MGFHGSGWWAYVSHDDKQEKPKIDRQQVLRVWEFAKPYRGRILALLGTIVVINLLTLLSPLLIQRLIDDAIPNANMTLLTWLALGIISIPLLNGGIGVFQRWLNSQVGEGVIYDLRRALYAHMQKMSLRFYTQSRTGELMSRLNNDVIGAQRAISDTFITFISNIIAFVMTLGIMLTLEWRLTLLGLAILPLFILPARRVGRILREIRRESMQVSAEMNATLNETLNVSGALLVKLFGRERREMDRFSNDARTSRDIGIRSAVVGRWFFMMLSVVSAVGVAAVYWVGARLVIEGAFTVGLIVAFGTYLRQLYGPLMSLTNAPVEIAQSLVSFERVFEVLDIPVEIEEAEEPAVLPEVNGRLAFKNVSFDYSQLAEGQVAGIQEVERFSWRGSGVKPKRGKEKEGVDVSENGHVPVEKPRWALENISFEIEPGQLVALVGPSGAGKTTTTYMIPRLYDPTAGNIEIDGHDIKTVTLKSLADNIGMVTQETYLFYDTVRANLLYARPEATEAEMVAATKAANIHDFIMSLPDQYDTVVGERGYRLSGGERQRMAIARVVLKNPRILVLDEATSSLDSLSEALIQEALQRVMAGRTSLVIAHRLSTILAADVILVMENGRLVEQGTHAGLLAQGGLYAELYETQFGGLEVA